MQSGNNRKKVLFLGAIIVGILGIGTLFWWLHARQYVWTNDAYIEGFNVSLSSDIEARITHLYVDEGDLVLCGDPICDLDRSIFDAQQEEAITNVNYLDKKLHVAQIHMEKLRDDYIVAKQEYEKAIISFLDFDHYEKNFKMAKGEYKSSLAALENAKARLGVINAWLKHTRVYAPMDGMIAKRWILAGDVANIGQPLFILNDLKNIWITANLEETKLERVKIGSPVKIHVDAYPGKEFTGHVFVLKASAASQFALIPPDNATGNFTKVVQRVPVKIAIDIPKNEKNYYLFPGMSCEVKIYIR